MLKSVSGFSFVEVMATSAMLGVIIIGSVKIMDRSSKSQKSTEERKFISKLEQELIAKLEVEKVCTDLFQSTSGDPSWNSLASNAPLKFTRDFNVKFPTLFDTMYFEENITENGVVHSRKKHISGTTINGMEVYPPMAADLPTVDGDHMLTLLVKFPISSKSTKKNLSKNALPFVFNINKSGTEIILKGCYARGSSATTQSRELCNAMGGKYIIDSCKFLSHPGSGASLDTWSDVDPNDYKSIREILCDIEKRVMETEKTALPAVVGTNGVEIIPAKAAIASPVSNYCSP